MHQTINGLVIRSVDYKESDKILSVLTDELGKITVSARSVRRKSSVLMPAVQLFAYSAMTLFENSGRYTLNEAETIEQFTGLRCDLDAMALASYLAEVLGTESEDNRIDPDVLRLALNSFYALSRQSHPRDRVKAAFELRYMTLGGYAPRLHCCARCSAEPEQPVFGLESGQLFCAGCSGSQRIIPLDQAALAAARYITRCDSKRLFSFRLDAGSMRILGDFSERYLLSRLERPFRTLHFYHTMAPAQFTT